MKLLDLQEQPDNFVQLLGRKRQAVASAFLCFELHQALRAIAREPEAHKSFGRNGFGHRAGAQCAAAARRESSQGPGPFSAFGPSHTVVVAGPSPQTSSTAGSVLSFLVPS